MPTETEFSAPPAASDVPARDLEIRRNPPRLLDFQELCVVLVISERHARSLIAERKIPTIRLGGRLIFDTAKVFAALERLAN